MQTPEKKEFLFVYGSLKKGFGHEMHGHLLKHSTFLSEGIYQGKLYRIDWYPGMVPSSDPTDRVYGEIYEMHHPELLLKILDSYEAYDAGNPTPCEYLREIQPVTTLENVTLSCYVYLYNWPIDQANQIPSGVF